MPAEGRCSELARTSGLFRDPDSARLRSTGLQQFWREHLLADSMLENGLYDEGRFIVVAPEQNRECQRQVLAYRGELARADVPRVAFEAVSLETVTAAIAAAGAVDLGRYLQDRYLNFASVDRAMFRVVGGKKKSSVDRAAA